MPRSGSVRQRKPAIDIDPSVILNLLADAIIAVDADDEIVYVNYAAEQLFGTGAYMLVGSSLTTLLSPDNPLFFIIHKCRVAGASYSERGVNLEGPRLEERFGPPWLLCTYSQCCEINRGRTRCGPV
ncbi:MAG: PAS domain-containing protein [Rhodobacteraceae bacterium]|nr:PAS domain-containing protein [Paracoccaceae bacterium]